MEQNQFEIVLLGIVYDTEKKKVLIGRRENDPEIENLTWCFPGGQLSKDKELEKTLKEKIKEKTGLKIENLGAVFAKTYPEKKELVAIYYLCEAVGGKEKAGDDFKELKWVKPEELEKYFTTSFHPQLREYILNLK